MKRTKEHERGSSIIELIIFIVAAGIALPSLFAIHEAIIRYNIQNDIKSHCLSLAEEKVEKILVFKKENPFWYKSIKTLAITEKPADNYSRKTTITALPSWGKNSLEGYQVTVKVWHPKLTSGYHLTLRLTNYAKEGCK
ncbi:MAG: hypothetical protein K8R79_08740 [Calditrichales bacterium]|nr:hypothetical protein [Calditrichales bacterium]